MKKLFLFASLLIAFFLSFSASAARQNWHAWVQTLKQEAVASGVDPQLFDKLFKNIRPSKRLIRLDRTQPETRLTYIKYRNTRADKFRIILGRREYKRYKPLIDKIGHEYGVSPCFIVALWDMESSCGRYMGNFSTIRALATLAYDSRRSNFFRKELILALHMVHGGHVKSHQFKGEWAGASGQPQFLPSSWHRYAVDYNKDGRKDIWKTRSDVFASIANYLAKNGWKSHEPWGIEVNVPANLSQNLLGLKHKQSVYQWRLLGIESANDRELPSDRLIGSIIHPYGGPYLLVFNNFRVLMRWNRSTFYAGTVGYVADKICRNY